MTDVLLRAGLSRNGTRAGDISYITLALPDAARGRAFYGAGARLDVRAGAGGARRQPGRRRHPAGGTVVRPGAERA